MSRFTDLFQNPVAKPKKDPIPAESVKEVKEEKDAESKSTTPILKAIQEKPKES